MSPFWILLELSMMEAVMTTGAVRRAKLQSNRHHQQTNVQIAYFVPVKKIPSRTKHGAVE